MSRFDLTRLTDQPFLEVGSAEEVLERYRQSKPTDPHPLFISYIAAALDYKEQRLAAGAETGDAIASDTTH